MLASMAVAMEACWREVCVVERSLCCEIGGLGLVGWWVVCEGLVVFAWFGLEGGVEGVGSPMTLISSAPAALSGLFSGSESSSSSKMVLRFVAEERLPSDGSFLVMLRP